MENYLVIIDRLALAICLAGYGALLWWKRGRENQPVPHPLIQIAFTMPYGMLVYLHGGSWIVAGLAWAAAFSGSLLGYSQYYPDVDPKYIDSPQDYDFLLRLIFGPDPRTVRSTYTTPTLAKNFYRQRIADYGASRLRVRNMIGLALSGMFITIVPGFLAGNLVLALSGASKTLAYEYGYWLGRQQPGKDWQQMAEATTGWFLYVFLIMAALPL